MFRTSLSVKVNVAIAIVLGLVLGAATWLNVTAQNRQAVENTKTQARILSKTLTNIIRIDMEGRCQKDVMKVIRMMGQFKDIETIRIFNADGVIMHSAEPGEIGKEVDELVYNVFTSADRSKPFKSEERGHRSFCMVEAMYNEPKCHTCHDPAKEIVGVLEVCLSMAQTERHIRQNARFMVATTVVSLLLVTGAISVLLHRMVNRPVRELSDTMKEVERGNLDVRSRVRGRDELGRLARSFNSMIARLDETSREVERLHREQMMRAERLASIGEMAASVAHEIKNPLAGLAGAAQVLSQGFGQDDPRTPVVGEMLKLIDRLDKTIRDLLSFARESVPNWQRANLNDVVEESVFFVDREEGGAREQVDLDLDPAVPEIPMDPQQIQQVALNLILNARHAVGKRGRVTVRTRARPSLGAPAGPGEGDWVELVVEDEGPGIPAETLNEIFKPFYTTKNQGTGLGLPICRKIVEAHGGRMHVESQVGVGSRFYVWLPVEQGGEAA